MAQKNQGGSVLGFIVVAIVMAGLLIGGAYAVRQLTSQPQVASESSPTQTQDQKDQQDEKKDTTPSENKNNDSQSQVKSSAGVGNATELPQTGAEGLLGPALIMGILSGMVVSYVRSRRLEPSF